MKKKMFMFILFMLLGLIKVNASCNLEERVEVNNAAGAVNVVADKLKYTYNAYDEEYEESHDIDAFSGIIYVYNLTPNIYFNITDGKDKETYTYADDVNGAIAISTSSFLHPVKAHIAARRTADITATFLMLFHSFFLAFTLYTFFLFRL